MKKKILFVTYGGGHVNMIIPVIHELNKTHPFDIHVLGLTTAAHALQREKIPYFGFQDIVKPSDKGALEKGKRLALDIESSIVAYDETIAYLGLSYQDLENQYSPNEALRLYRERGRGAFLPTNIMERILKELEPDLVVTTNSPRSEQAAIIAATKLNIPTICLIDLFPFRDKWLWQEMYATKTCVLCDLVKGFAITSGKPPDSIVVTGNPAFDVLAQAGLVDKASAFRNKKSWGSDHVILFASESDLHQDSGLKPTSSVQIAQKLMEIVTKHPKLRLILRPHPSENTVFKDLPPRVYVSTKDDNLPILLNAVDSVVTRISTVGFQGVLLGKPFLSVICPVLTPRLSFADLGLAHSVENLDALEGDLLFIIKNGWKPETSLPTIGGAAERVSVVINDVLKTTAR